MNLFKEFQEFRRILCVCPDCDTIVRVSDLKLISKGKGIKTWLDNHERKISQMEKKEEKFEEVRGKLREEAVKKGRKEAEIVFNRAINKSFKSLKYDPFDLKPILNPIDFLVFKDMEKKEEVNDIILLSEKLTNPYLNKLRTQIKNCVSKNNYDWQVARIDEDGRILIE